MIEQVAGHALTEGHRRQIPQYSFDGASDRSGAEDECFRRVEADVDAGEDDVRLFGEKVAQRDIHAIRRRAADRPSFYILGEMGGAVDDLDLAMARHTPARPALFKGRCRYRHAEVGQ